MAESTRTNDDGDDAYDYDRSNQLIGDQKRYNTINDAIEFISRKPKSGIMPN